MTRALTAETYRLLSVRSTAVFAVLLIGSCVGPIILMGVVYDPAYRGPIDAGDLGKCVSVFHVVAIVFAGAHTATEARSGSIAVSFLTQRARWTSLAAQTTVESAFLLSTYVIGMCLALTAATFYPDGLTMTARGWAYLALYPLIVVLWAATAASLAVLTRSVAASVAAPITWMLLIEQLVSMLPMLDVITPWLPFTASHTLLAHALGEASAAASAWPSAVAVLAPVLALATAALLAHVRRDAA
ncbi:ABC transporter permease [Nocardiopsis sp. HUAS JQ3]|uniref:ABC transporter permease n=1 Tax=Nocardiopsis sp. HUAS JQ3 TaxID=3061629 RepID=UPI0023A9A421|nr:ABC transporter permease [Nocardiopsis sp. HUAS JQ3]WDZ91020.1 ABC transporter permease [Nocardiopsis sp. HUAS JQ3]